ncbi:MAG: aryl-sulfate sulfotransferase [Crocinitomicaceae bacterium]|nr:aryl-sulfate sulfotransferase [Crocinitomicaceae bacterium]
MKKAVFTFVLLFVAVTSFSQQTVGLFSTTPNVYPGYTLFGPKFSTTSYLIDNCGNLQYTWSSQYAAGGTVQLLEDGTLLRMCDFANGSPISAGGAAGRIEAIQPDQQLAWSLNLSNDSLRNHHDFEPLPNGNLLIIVWEVRTKQEAIDQGRDTSLVGGSGLWPEYLMEYNPVTDAVDWEWRSWDHLIQDYDSTKPNYGVVSEHPELIDLNYTSNGSNPDWQHFNSIAYNETLDQIMLSSPFFNEIYIIDHSTTTAESASHTGGNSGRGGDILWRWGNPQAYGIGDSTTQQMFFQHDPHWIPEGYPDENKIIVFNNGRGRTPVEYSTVDILEPSILGDGSYEVAGDGTFLPAGVHYRYAAPVETDFYSKIISSASQMPNGNIIIDEGNQGHFFEIDSSDSVVWDYVCPVVQDSILEQEEAIPGTPTLLFNGCFRALKYGTDYSGLSSLPLTDQGPIELNPYVSLCDISSVFEQNLESIEVYPNPTTGMINIINISSEYKFNIRNTAGELLMEGQLANHLDLSKFSNGLYFIEITDKLTGLNTTMRVIKE